MSYLPFMEVVKVKNDFKLTITSSVVHSNTRLHNVVGFRMIEATGL